MDKTNSQVTYEIRVSLSHFIHNSVFGCTIALFSV